MGKRRREEEEEEEEEGLRALPDEILELVVRREPGLAESLARVDRRARALLLGREGLVAPRGRDGIVFSLDAALAEVEDAGSAVEVADVERFARRSLGARMRHSDNVLRVVSRRFGEPAAPHRGAADLLRRVVRRAFACAAVPPERRRLALSTRRDVDEGAAVHPDWLRIAAATDATELVAEGRPLGTLAEYEALWGEHGGASVDPHPTSCVAPSPPPCRVAVARPRRRRRYCYVRQSPYALERIVVSSAAAAYYVFSGASDGLSRIAARHLVVRGTHGGAFVAPPLARSPETATYESDRAGALLSFPHSHDIRAIRIAGLGDPAASVALGRRGEPWDAYLGRLREFHAEVPVVAPVGFGVDRIPESLVSLRFPVRGLPPGRLAARIARLGGLVSLDLSPHALSAWELRDLAGPLTSASLRRLVLPVRVDPADAAACDAAVEAVGAIAGGCAAVERIEVVVAGAAGPALPRVAARMAVAAFGRSATLAAFAAGGPAVDRRTAALVAELLAAASAGEAAAREADEAAAEARAVRGRAAAAGDGATPELFLECAERLRAALERAANRAKRAGELRAAAGAARAALAPLELAA